MESLEGKKDSSMKGGSHPMKVMDALEKLEFRETTPHAQPLFVSAGGRILRFALRPGQKIAEHSAPNSPLYLLVLQGRGVFTGGDGTEQTCGPNALLVFDPGESGTRCGLWTRN